MVLKIGVHQSSGFHGATAHRGYFASFRKISLFETDLFEDKIFHEVEILSLGSFIHAEGLPSTPHPPLITVVINFDHYPY